MKSRFASRLQRSHDLLYLTVPLSAALLLVSCKRQPSTDSAAGAGAGGGPGTSAGAGAGAPDTGPAKPGDHRAILALIDFSAFPKIDDAKRHEVNPTNANFSRPKKDAGTVKSSVESLEKFAASQGWKPASDAGGYAWTDSGGVAFYRKDGAVLQASVGVSRGLEPGSQEVNAGLFLIGNVDARSLPRVAGSKVMSGDFSTAQISSPADVKSVRKSNKEKLSALGWTEYRMHMPPGFQRPAEDLEKEQYFIQNGTSISCYFTPKGAQTEYIVRCELLQNPLPVLPQAEMVELQPAPALVTFFVKLPSDQVLNWYKDTLGKDGWAVSPAPATEEKTTRHQFHKAGQKPLFLQCLRANDDTIVRVSE